MYDYNESLPEKVLDWLMKHVMSWVAVIGICLVLTLVIGLICGGIYRVFFYEPPQTFELRLDSWTCTRSHLREREICGKTCHWIEETVCDQYTSK
jgi:hypothetical protein